MPQNLDGARLLKAVLASDEGARQDSINCRRRCFVCRSLCKKRESMRRSKARSGCQYFFARGEDVSVRRGPEGRRKAGGHGLARRDGQCGAGGEARRGAGENLRDPIGRERYFYRERHGFFAARCRSDPAALTTPIEAWFRGWFTFRVTRANVHVHGEQV